MAEANISVAHDQFICPVCLDLLKDPVTMHCGHCFCKVCINSCWDQEDAYGVYCCPQCTATFYPRPDIRRNNVLADVVEKLKTEIQAAFSQCYAGPGDVEMWSVECGVWSRVWSRAERLREQLEQEIADLQRRVTELEQLTHTHDDLHFLQEIKVLVSGHRSPKFTRPDFQSDLREDSGSITINQHRLFDGVRKSLSVLNKRFEEFCLEELIKIPEHVEDLQVLLPEPKSRDEFLKYFCDLTLDPNTVHDELILSENNRVVMYSGIKQQYSDHPERFDSYSQVLSKESVRGRCYWEVEWSGDGVCICVSYKDISRKGYNDECCFGNSNQSWSLYCSSYSHSFNHNRIITYLTVPSSSRIGVYVDHSAGTLSFYSVSDTMMLLHRVHTTFTQPLHAGFWLYYDYISKSRTTVRLCHPTKL
ncbi:hypothetical protein AMELA_G00017690 [Ameiurus melas]|uniref:Tripartite motif-containing protein 16-like n=1 Tax=Ameiurus melas TaxID=219545 RepID=A0A7J6BAS6_AMEME|nr:hypothetical protein AMELA_G00017690 [Ameiurus melas]